jgi:acyl transferase domain-containing protein
MAITGIGCVFPKAENLSEYWANIKKREDAITTVPPTHWNPDDYFDSDPRKPDHTYSQRGGFISPIDFDPLEFAISPNTLEAIDTTQLLSMMAAKRALEDAGYGPGSKKTFNRDKTSVILGVTGTLELVIPLGARLGHPRWRKALKEAGAGEELAEKVVKRISDLYVGWQESSFPGLLGNVVAGRIANFLDLGGTNCVVDAACASSLSAIHVAALELSTGKSDLVLTGGADTFNDIFMYMCFSKTPALSPTGDAKPFDHKCDGTILGEGMGIVALRRLEDAKRDGDRIYAVIRGIGSGSDGKGVAIFAPKSDGQVKAMEDAYRSAGVSPRTVELMEAHGTGTSVGDATEIASIIRVYGNGAKDTQWCALGSVKSQIGHTKASAGVAGLIKIAMALYYKTLPPTIKVEYPMEQLAGGDTPFYVNTEKRPWMPSRDFPRRAAVSAFGFGGSNFHCVLEESDPEKTETDWEGDVQILAFSSDSIDGLKQDAASWPASLTWKETCRRAVESRKAFDPGKPYRMAVPIEKGKKEPDKIIATILAMLEKHPDKKSFTTPDGACFGSGAPGGGLGVLFPGQGSQYVGMLRDMTCQFPAMLNVLAGADESFVKNRAEGIEDPLGSLIYPIPPFRKEEKDRNEMKLRDTRVAQPALGAVSLGAYRVLQEMGMKPDALAGHSYGELTALCASGVITPEELHRLSALRGSLMAGREGDLGSMLAVQAGFSAIESILRENSLDLVIANRNAPEQCVLSGATPLIERAAEVFTAAGIRSTRLPVSAAFHSPLVSDAQAPFAAALKKLKLQKPSIPVFSNTTGKEYPGDPAQAAGLLSGQLAKPVLFVDEIQAIYDSGVRTFLEVGPGARLTGLVKAILKDRDGWEAASIDSSGGKGSGTFDLARAFCLLTALGHSISIQSWSPLTEGEKREMAKPRPKMTIPICGANHVSPATRKIQDTPMTPVQSNYQEAKEMPTHNSPNAPQGGYGEALMIIQQNMESLQKIQEQTARLHQQFLESQDNAIRTMNALAEQQRVLFGVSLGIAPAAQTAPATQLIAPPPPPSFRVVEAAPAPVPAAPPTPPVAPSPSAGQAEASQVIMELVSEKTGYPVEMLEPGMSLDSDLGIDSIKRVEIFSALRDRLPGAQAIKAEHMNTLKTLQSIAQFIAESSPGGTAPTECRDDRTPCLSPPVQVSGEDAAPEPFVLIEHLYAEDDEGKEPPAPEEGTLKRLILQAVPLEGEERKIEINMARGAEILIAGEDPPMMKAVGEILATFGYRPKAVSLSGLESLTLPQSLGGLMIVAPPEGTDGGFILNAFRLLRMAGPALRESARKDGALFVTLSRMDGSFGLGEGKGSFNPLSGGLSGLAKTVRHEWPEVYCKAMDLSPAFKSHKEAAADVVDEMFIHGPIEVGLSPGARHTLQMLQQEASDTGRFPLGREDVLVITGGARGVTGECAAAIAERLGPASPQMVLLGRSPQPGPEPEWLAELQQEAQIKKEIAAREGKKISPRQLEEKYRSITTNREINKTLSRIRAAGGAVHYASADVRDGKALAGALQSIRSGIGPIKGIVHGAGVIADRLIADKTDDEFTHVYETKAGGLLKLLEATKDDGLKVIALFSSSTGRYGRTGQADYAVANETLNKTAQAQSQLHPGCRVVSINWGPWEGGMVTPALREIFLAEGVGLIPLRDGSEQLIREMSAPAGNPVEVVVQGVIGNGGPRQDTPQLSLSIEREISLNNFPFLKSHVINGKAVMPVSMMVELMAHGAMHCNPGLSFLGLDDFRVLKGIKLAGDETVKMRVMAGRAERKDGFFLVASELKSSTDGRKWDLNVRSEIVLSTVPISGERLIPRRDLPPCPVKPKDAYGSLLFHGPHLQGLREIKGCSSWGITGTVDAAPKPSEWVRKPLRSRWLADPMALDGAFQMMILWSFQEYGSGSLPCRLGSLRQFKAFPGDQVEISIQVEDHNDSRAISCIEFTNPQGELVARIENYECTIDPSLKEAFARNDLAAEELSYST